MGAAFEVLDVQVLEFICCLIFDLVDELIPNVNFSCSCFVFEHSILYDECHLLGRFHFNWLGLFTDFLVNL